MSINSLITSLPPLVAPITDPCLNVISEGLDEDYQAILDKGLSLGYALPSADVQNIGNNTVIALKDNLIWAKISGLWVTDTDGDSDFATLNWKDPDNFQLTKNGSLIFGSLQGFTGHTASSANLNTGFNPLTEWGASNNSNFSVGAYTKNIGSGFEPLIGADDGDNDILYSPSSATAGNVFPRMGEGGPEIVAVNEIGFHHVDRASSASRSVFINGVEFTSARVVVSVPDEDVTFFKFGGSYSDTQLSVGFIAESLSSEASTFFSIIETYIDMVALL